MSQENLNPRITGLLPLRYPLGFGSHARKDKWRLCGHCEECSDNAISINLTVDNWLKYNYFYCYSYIRTRKEPEWATITFKTGANLKR